jgi:Cdc6-like AAA superfamily ATPase
LQTNALLGKTTVCRLYAKFLASVGVLPGDFVIETTGSRLANDNVAGCKKHIEEIQNNGGGALFIDEAYQLVSGHNYGGKQVLDFLLAEMENLTGKVAFIVAGYNKQMEDFFAHNPGLPSRIPHQLQFQDYDDDELLRILHHRIEKKYRGTMKVEGGMGGLYLRIVSRRIGSGRGREGFGNARAVHNALDRIEARQAGRLRRERRAAKNADDFLLTMEDLLGPEPSSALKNTTAWEKLHKLIGLKSVKESVKILLDRIQLNYHRELEEKPLIQCSLNRVFVGSPGTGKTSVAKLYGQILADIGLLSSGEG